MVKRYIYDDNGILQRISVYKNGLYVGDAPVEKLITKNIKY